MQFNTKLIENNIDIFICVETWLNSNHTDNYICSLENYNIFRRDREGCRGGGILICLKSQLNVMLIENMKSNYEELWVLVKFKSVKLIICCFYNPNSNINVTDHLENQLLKLESLNLNYDILLILGDFNYNLNNLNSNGENLFNLMNLNGLKQLIDFETCKNSILDLVFTDNLNIIKDVKVTENLTESCDHKAIEIQLNAEMNLDKSIYTKEITYFDDDAYEKINYDLYNADYNDKFKNCQNIEEVYKLLKDYVN